jgi:oxygen-independent coproporphyrinogen-3 oxidase
MTDAILLRHGEARLPRYTSYPTAPVFSPAVGAAAHARELAGLAPDEPVSLYVHVPFCRSMCWYCGCHTTITARDEPIEAYLAALHAELALVAGLVPSPLPVAALHFGGGTPTIMGPERFGRLMAALRRHVRFTADAELAIEIDPRTLTPDMIAALAEGGITRASLGVQSFDPAVQQAINRVQSIDETAAAVAGLRAAGIGRINFDLIYGLPQQTVESCRETAEAALALAPDRFAVFGYAHVPAFKKHQRLIDEAALPGGAERIAEALAIGEALVAAGYRPVGLDHFARPDDPLAEAAATGRLHRNFQGYTTDDCPSLIGLGASAIGQTRGGYVQNEVPIGRYQQAVAAGRLATARGYRLTADDRLRGEVIERLMCDLGADVGAIAARHGADAAALLDGNDRLRALVDDGVAEIAGGVVHVPARHRFLVRTVAAAFDAYLDPARRPGSKVA